MKRSLLPGITAHALSSLLCGKRKSCPDSVALTGHCYWKSHKVLTMA
jgi:hypothetical protein